MDILEHIDKLESMTSQAKRVPITGRAMIDAERLEGLIDQMRLAVPRNVQEAQEVLDRREQIINQTMLDARRIRAVAETDARGLVDESELVKLAKKRGDEIVAEAQERAARLLQAVEVQVRKKQAGADQFAQDSLVQLEEQVLNVLNVIHAGQRILTPVEDSLAANL
jgi:vacuolar-type H+-ATPase subunit H